MDKIDRLKSFDRIFGKRSPEDEFWQDYINKMIWAIESGEIPRFEPLANTQDN